MSTAKTNSSTSIRPLDFPPLPELNLGSDRQKVLEKWYEDLKTSLVTEFESIRTLIDRINNST